MGTGILRPHAMSYAPMMNAPATGYGGGYTGYGGFGQTMAMPSYGGHGGYSGYGQMNERAVIGTEQIVTPVTQTVMMPQTSMVQRMIQVPQQQQIRVPRTSYETRRRTTRFPRPRCSPRPSRS